MFIDLLIFYFYVNNKYFIIIQKYDICCHNAFISKWKYLWDDIFIQIKKEQPTQ